MEQFLETLKGLREKVEDVVVTTEWQTKPPMEKMCQWIEIKGAVINALLKMNVLEEEIRRAKGTGKRHRILFDTTNESNRRKSVQVELDESEGCS